MKITKDALPGGPGNLHMPARIKFDRAGIARNRTGTTIRPNDEDGKRSRVKITNGALPGGSGNLRTPARTTKVLSSRNRAKSHMHHNQAK